MTAAQRRMRARAAAHARWAKEDGVEGTAKARAAFMSKFEQQVDPDGVLPEEERQRRATAARKAHFTTLALKSSQARSERAAQRKARYANRTRSN